MALSLRSPIIGTPDKHFAELWHHDARLIVDENTVGVEDSMSAVLDKQAVGYTMAYQKAFLVKDGSGVLSKADVVTPCDAEGFGSYFSPNSSFGGETPVLPEDGILINYTYTKYHDVSVGDTLQLIDTEGRTFVCKVAGLTEHYLSINHIVMSAEYYERLTGGSAAANIFYIRLNGADMTQLETALYDQDLFSCVMGACISALFALITNLIALRKVNKLNISDLNKL